MRPALVRKNAGSGHSYTLGGEWLPGVTTVLGVLDKPALPAWAARESAAYADEHWQRLSGMRSADRLREIEGARFATNKKATSKGHRIHSLAERLQAGESVEVPEEILPDVEGVAKMLDDFALTSVATEAAIASVEWGYAGTFDALLESPRWGLCLVDFKTGKKIYNEVALQLAAYRAADTMALQVEKIGPRGGISHVWENHDMPPVDHTFAAHVTPTGTSLVPVRSDGAIFGAFLSVLDAFKTWTMRTDRDYRDRGHYDPPVGDVVFPESDLSEEY